MSDHRRFVVVGGGLAGGRAAEALRELGFSGDLALLTEEPRLPHERPPLSKEYLLGRIGPERLLTRPPGYYAEQAIEVRTGTRVVALEPGRHRLRLAGGEEIPYHQVLLAPGSEAVRPRLPGAELPGVETLRSVEDADRLRRQMHDGSRVVVLGGGFLGSEVASAARQRGCEVHLVEAQDSLLAPMGDAVAELALAAHRGQGVRVELGLTVTEFRGGSHVEAARLADGRELPCQLAVLCVGARPRVDLARAAGLRLQDGILVDGRSMSSAPGVLVAGDAARFWHPGLGRSLRLEHWDNAQSQGRHAAAAMLGATEPYRPLPYFWTELYGTLVQQVGLWERGREEVRRGEPGNPRLSLFQLDRGRVTACIAVNRFPDLKRARILISSGREVDRALLGDPAADLAALAAVASAPD